MTLVRMKEKIRNNIINSVQVYKAKLAGKYYLYIFENQYFEMYLIKPQMKNCLKLDIYSQKQIKKHNMIRFYTQMAMN